ncbi:TspO/MBR family protein [Microbacterium indicum]|uniref:TspO/MBR family protein n=1 Tax=Microbacterium indicum TaxID=358100 RepID=UPI00041AE6CC|nr:TspO/MBR family protein [Microbacterium indicum]
MTNSTPRPQRQIIMAACFLAVVAATAVVGSLASVSHTDGWYADVEKVPWNPANGVFGPAWSILYLLIALAGFLIWRSGFRAPEKNAAKRVLVLFAVQMVLNALWTPIFFAGYPLFGESAWWAALIVIAALLVAVVWLGVAARRWSRTASLLMLPYGAWLAFATSLNIGIIVLN